MNSLLSLPPSLRITLFCFEMLASALLMLCIVYGIMGKRNKLYISYLVSLFVSLIVMILTRTPVVLIHNVALAGYFNLVLVVPIVLGIICIIKMKRYILIVDVVMCIINIPFFEIIPYYGYIVSGLFIYVVARSILALYANLEYIKKYPGRIAIKQAFDSLLDGIAFANSFGRITYINNSLKDTLISIDILSHNKMKDIVNSIKQKAIENGRIVSENTYIVKIKDNFYKFSSDKALSQLSCIDVTNEESLIQQIENNKVLLEKANKELNENLDKIDEIQKEAELLSIKGQIHDNLAQQLSILHMFILNDKSNDLVELKNMLKSLEITENTSFEEDYISSLINLLKMIDVDLTISGEIPQDLEIKAFIHKLLKETTTNAIKHGMATYIHVSIEQKENSITICVTNNGYTPNKIEFGNGLNSILAELNKHKGTIDFNYQDQFSIIATLEK